MSESPPPAGSGHKKLFKDAVVLTGGTYLARGVQILAGFIRAKYLGPSLFGLWNGLTIIQNYSAYTTGGLGQALNRELPMMLGRRDEAGVERVNSAVAAVYLSQGLIFLAGLIGVGLLVWPTAGPEVGLGLMAVGLLVLMDRFFEYLEMILMAHLEFGAVSLGPVIWWSCHLGLFFLLVPRWGIYGFYVVAVVSFASNVIYWLIACRRFLPSRLKFDWPEIWRLVKVGFPFQMGMALETVFVSADRIMIVTFLGVTKLGYYAVGVMVTATLQEVPLIMSAILMPRLFRRYGEDESLDTIKPFLFFPTMIMALAAPALLVSVSLLLPVILEVFLPKYLPALPAFKYLLFAAMFSSMASNTYSVLFALNRQRLIILVNACGIFLVVILNTIVLGLGWDIEGIALATAVAQGLSSTMLLWTSFSYFIYNPRLRLRQMIRVYAPGLLMLPAAWIIGYTWPVAAHDFWSGLGLLLAEAGVCLFGGGLLWLALNKGTRELAEVLFILRRRKIKAP